VKGWLSDSSFRKKIENKNAGIASGIRELLLSFIKYFVQWKAGEKQNVREEIDQESLRELLTST